MTNTARHYVYGNTYPIKDQLKQDGFKWDKVEKAWWSSSEELKVKYAALTERKQSGRRYAFRPCGYPDCSPDLCDDCDGKGLQYRRR